MQLWEGIHTDSPSKCEYAGLNSLAGEKSFLLLPDHFEYRIVQTPKKVHHHRARRGQSLKVALCSA